MKAWESNIRKVEPYVPGEQLRFRMLLNLILMRIHMDHQKMSEKQWKQ